MQEAITAPVEDDEISLIDLFAVLLRYKVMIIVLTLLSAVGVVVFAVISLKLPPEKSPLPNQFTPEAHMLINDSSSGGGGGLSSMLSSSSLGSLASLVGISGVGGSSNSTLAVYLVSSNSLLDAVTDKFGIIDRYKIEKYVRAESRKALKKTLQAEVDDDSGVFTVSFTDIDPVFAQEVVNFVVDWLSERFDELGLDSNKIKKENLEKNIQASYDEILRLEREVRNLGASVSGGMSAWDLPSIAVSTARIQMELEAQKEVYTQLKIQYELLKVDMQSESPVFQILERPEVPDQKSKPSRGMLCIIVVFATFFLSAFLAFALNAFKNIRNDPEAWGKLTQKQDEEK